MLFWLCCSVLSAAVVLGGATHAGYLGDVAAQLLSVPLLIVVLWPAASAHHQQRREARFALYLCGVAAALVCIQVLPLPFDVWSAGASLMQQSPPSDHGQLRTSWGTLSLVPQATWAAAASSIVPLSIFGAVTQLGFKQRRVLSWLLLGLGSASLVLGLLQVAQGPGSLRFYDVTNQTEAVGFFANRNHFAALLYVSLLLAGMHIPLLGASISQGRAFRSRTILWLAGAAALLAAFLGGLALARSRAGIILAMIALAGVIANIRVQRQFARSTSASSMPIVAQASFGAVVFAILFAAQFGLGGILARFEVGPAEDLRVTFNRVAWETIPKTLPFGTGLGTFVPVYAAAEKRDDVFAGYANRAHNDLAEMLLETGLLGAALLLAFLAWLARRAIQVWKKPQSSQSLSHLLMERTAVLVAVLLLAHSLVDYPLRTTALSAIFAYFCAVLAVPVSEPSSEPAAKLRHTRPLPVEPVQAERWDFDAKWPQTWKKEPGASCPEKDLGQTLHNPTTKS